MTSAREEVLSRIRTALGERRPDVGVPRDYRTADERPAEQLREVLVGRLRTSCSVIGELASSLTSRAPVPRPG